MSLRLHVVFHGAGPAFYRMPGCPCARCQPPALPDEPSEQDYADLLAWNRQAHTSASLVIEGDGVAIDHTLIDCGMGVVTNLATLPTPAYGQPINRILLTHGHNDHIGGLEGLLHSLQLARTAGDFTEDEQPWPLPVFATRQTWQRKLGHNPANPAESGAMRSILHYMDHQDITDVAHDLATLELHPALLVTPIPVEHYLDSVNYLCEFWPSGSQNEGDPVRIALCWDLLAYPAGRAEDFWQGVALDPHQGPLADLLTGVDLLAIEMTDWRPGPYGHIGFLDGMYTNKERTGYGVRDLIAAWQPQQTRLVHYSGTHDRILPDGTWWRGAELATNQDPARGPVSDTALRQAVRAALGDAIAVDIAQPGETLTCS